MTAACLVLALAAACLGLGLAAATGTDLGFRVEESGFRVEGLLGLAAATGTDLGGDVTAIALPETIDGVPQREAKRERE